MWMMMRQTSAPQLHTSSVRSRTRESEGVAPASLWRKFEKAFNFAPSKAATMAVAISSTWETLLLSAQGGRRRKGAHGAEQKEEAQPAALVGDKRAKEAETGPDHRTEPHDGSRRREEVRRGRMQTRLDQSKRLLRERPPPVRPCTTGMHESKEGTRQRFENSARKVAALRKPCDRGVTTIERRLRSYRWSVYARCVGRVYVQWSVVH